MLIYVLQWLLIWKSKIPFARYYCKVFRFIFQEMLTWSWLFMKFLRCFLLFREGNHNLILSFVHSFEMFMNAWLDWLIFSYIEIVCPGWNLKYVEKSQQIIFKIMSQNSTCISVSVDPNFSFWRIIIFHITCSEFQRGMILENWFPKVQFL